MFNLEKNWPAWLFFGTLVAAAASTILSHRYVTHVSDLQSKQRALNKLKADYDSVLFATKFDANLQGFKAQQIQITAMVPDCEKYKFLGQPGCSTAEVQMYKLHEPLSVPDQAAKQKIDADAAKIKAFAEATNKAGAKVNDLQPIYDFVQNIMKPIVSVVVLCASIFVILSQKYKGEAEKWAFGSLGTILGVWLK